MSEQPRYRVAERSFIDNVLVEPGGEVTYTGEPGEHLQPLNASAEKAVAAVLADHPDADASTALRQSLSLLGKAS